MMSVILCSRWKLDPQESRRSMVKLRSAAETCKHVLSTVSTAHCFVESLCEGVDFSYNITRARFENLITSYLSEYLQPVHEVLEKAGLNSKIIAKVGDWLSLEGLKRVFITVAKFMVYVLLIGKIM